MIDIYVQDREDALHVCVTFHEMYEHYVDLIISNCVVLEKIINKKCLIYKSLILLQ